MQRARSAADKTRRSEDLLAAAQALAVELNGVRHVTLDFVPRVGELLAALAVGLSGQSR